MIKVGAIFIILIFGFIACLWIRTWNVKVKPTVQSSQRMTMSHLATYNSDTLTLTLKGRGAEFAKCIKIKNDRDIEVAYEPLTVHVGSATVGGVTTGGVYTTGDYHYISGEKKNGLCRLEYTGCLVAKIQLSEALYAQAQESNIKKYLNSEKQIEVIKPEALSADELKLAYQLLTTTGYAGNNFVKNGYPKFEKCKEIMDWIIGTDLGALNDTTIEWPKGGSENTQTVSVATNDGLAVAAKIFLILGCIAQGWLLLPLAWCLPITISACNRMKKGEPVGTGLKVCALLFVNLIGGILLLCRSDDK